MNAAAIRAAILAADDLPREPVDVPWDLEGAKVYVRGMTAAEKDRWVARTMPDGEFRWTPNLTAELVAVTLVTEDGERVFTDEDAIALGGQGAGTLSDLFTTAMRLSGLSEGSAAAVEADLRDRPERAFLHRLAIALGKSLGEVGRMPAQEVMAWAVFEQEFGPLTMQERADALTAMICWSSFAARGGKSKVADFMPEWRGPVRWESDADWLSLLAKKGTD